MIGVVSLQFGSKVYFDLSQHLLSAYADNHKYELLIGSGGMLSDGRARHWGKLPLILQALRTCELVLYLDADAVIVDPSRKVESLLPYLESGDMLAARDSAWNVNTGAMLIRSSARSLLDSWAALPTEFPELGHTWPLDELAFNRHILPSPDLRRRIVVPKLERGTVCDFIGGTFIQHFCNGNERQKLARMTRATQGHHG